MNWRSCLAHGVVTGHSRFFHEDGSGWICLDCDPPPTCQHPVSGTALCPNPAEPDSPFCSLHQPQAHLRSRE